MRVSLHRGGPGVGMDPKKPAHARIPTDDGPDQEEIGATAGKTHDQVLDEVIGPERRMRNERRARGEP